MRIEDTADLCDLVEQFIRKAHPSERSPKVIDKHRPALHGIQSLLLAIRPPSGHRMRISCNVVRQSHPTDNYIQQLRLTLPVQFPGVEFAFLPADMVGQI